MSKPAVLPEKIESICQILLTEAVIIRLNL
jgi:hypothetical protein